MGGKTETRDEWREEVFGVKGVCAATSVSDEVL